MEIFSFLNSIFALKTRWANINSELLFIKLTLVNLGEAQKIHGHMSLSNRLFLAENISKLEEMAF